MNLFKQTSSPEKLARLEKIRAKGRTHFILYTGVLGWGLSVFAMTTIWAWYDNHGWHFPSEGIPLSECGHAAVRLAVWLTAGYFFGADMWKRFGFENPANAQSATTPHSS
jgi:hypothetical protein